MKIRDDSTIKVLAIIQSCSEFLILNRKQILRIERKEETKKYFFSRLFWAVQHQKQFYVIRNHLSQLVEIGLHVREVSLYFLVVITWAVRQSRSEVDFRPEVILDYFHYRPMKRKKKTDL